MGMATYGQLFTLAGQRNGFSARTTTAVEKAYRFICKDLAASQWAVIRDSHQQAPYAHRGDQWMGYDDMESIRVKAEYVLNKGLAGGMIWSLGMDDFDGECHGRKFPLTQTVKDVFLRQVN